MDDQVRKAEELMEERLRNKKPNGHPPADAPAPAADPKVEELTRDLQRMTADFQNYRKRNEAERVDFVKYAKADLILKLLNVLDGYDRALETIPAELATQPWVEGMRLVERKLRSTLEAEGLTTVDSVGKPFDPYLHEAVAHVESDQPENTVIAEFQKAYRLHDRIIRPALVTVAKSKNE
ncbi:MAG: nucleotide exchange factor GrpE [Chloroflexi bacterium]|nr:nucleotide exchange factor GrpE [Chloroflexota bacterium]